MKRIIKNKNWKLNKEYDFDKILYLLIDRPTRINVCNDYIWQNNEGKWHRDYDLPAFVDNVYDCFWYKNHNRYREGNKLSVICFKNNIKI